MIVNGNGSENCSWQLGRKAEVLYDGGLDQEEGEGREYEEI
jgi:hypothetical protein